MRNPWTQKEQRWIQLCRFEEGEAVMYERLGFLMREKKLVSGTMPKDGGAKNAVKERLGDTAAALQAAGVTGVPVRYLDGDTSCFKAPGAWLVASGPFGQVAQAQATCAAMRGQGEFAANPSIDLTIRSTQQSAPCG